MLLVMFSALLAGSPLVDAVKQGDVPAVRSLIKSGADVRAPEGDGATALHWAAHRDSIDLVRLLLDAGAQAQAANDLGVTPLHLAAANGNPATMPEAARLANEAAGIVVGRFGAATVTPSELKARF